jgi:hypothetical protein
MSLQQAYLRFLASPSAAALSSSPSMHFITTLVTVNSAESITKYLSRESTQLKKRVEKPLSAIETADSLVLEMETEIEFLSSGGNYLPALDDNFLSDQVVMVPIVSLIFMFRLRFLDCARVSRLIGTLPITGFFFGTWLAWHSG